MSLGALLFSPDGQILASGGSYDRLICLWQVGTGRKIRQWLAHQQGIHRFTRGVLSLTFSPDGQRLVSTGADNKIVVWDVKTGRPMHQLVGRRGTAAALAFSPNGKMLVTGGTDRAVRLWEAATGRRRHTFTGHRGHISTVHFSPDGRKVVSGGSDTSVLVWDVFGAMSDVQPLTSGELEQTWRHLGDRNAFRAFQAVRRLVRSPKLSVPFLNNQLKPVMAADAKRVSRLIGALDSPRFANRERAATELLKLGEAALPGMKKAFRGKLTLEARLRLKKIMTKVQNLSTPQQLRSLRGIEVLEYIGSPAVKAILTRLARGVAGARITREARAALKRNVN